VRVLTSYQLVTFNAAEGTVDVVLRSPRSSLRRPEMVVQV